MRASVYNRANFSMRGKYGASGQVDSKDAKAAQISETGKKVISLGGRSSISSVPTPVSSKHECAICNNHGVIAENVSSGRSKTIRSIARKRGWRGGEHIS